MTAALRIDARRPRWKPLPQPHALERAYYARLMAVVERAFALLRKRLAAHLPPDVRRQDAAEDEPPDNFKAVTFTIEEVEFELAESFPATSIRKAAESTATEIDNAHLRSMRRQFSEATGIDVLKEAPKLRPTVEEFTKRNVDLIKSIPKEAMEGLRHALVAAGLEKGVRPERLAKMLEERYGVAQRRAQLIATDQVGKLMSSLTEERHRELGVTKYRWRTSRDNRVRRLHVRREGKVFSYDDPPNEVSGDGHAGSAVRCRCWQEPIITEQAMEKLQSEAAPKPKTKPTPTGGGELSPAVRSPVKKKSTPARKTAKKSPSGASSAQKKPTTKVTTRPATPKSAARPPALRHPRAKGDLPHGAVRGAEAAAVMAEFPALKELGNFLRVDDYSNQHVRKQVADIASLPPPILQHLAEAVDDIHVSTKNITDLGRSGHMARSKGERPRGWEEGETFEQTAGVYIKSRREVLVSAPLTAGYDSSVVLHEIGHAIDGPMPDNQVSRTPEFESAWKDFTSGNYVNSRHPYFNQEYPAGAEETFAEAFSLYFGRNKSEAVKHFGPRVVELLEAKYGPDAYPPKDKP